MRLFLLTLLLLGIAGSSSAQAELAPQVKSFNAQDYDGHPQVMCTLMDSSTGRLFMGASNEVLIYEGNRFQRIKTGSGHSVFSMGQDAKGRIWLGCQSDMGYLKSTEKGELRYVSLLDSSGKGDSIRKDFNIIWDVHCFEGKIFFNGIRKIFVHDPQKGGLEKIEPEKRFYFASRIGNELFVQDFDTGLIALDMEQLGKRIVPGSGELQGTRIVKCLPYAEGNADPDTIMVATRRAGILLLSDGKMSRIEMEEELAERIRSDGIYTAEWGPKNTLLLGTDRGGLLLLKIRNGKVIERERIDRKRGSPANAIWDISAPSSPSGMLWAGTENGLAYLNPFRSLRTLYEGERLKGGINDIERIPDRADGKLALATTRGVQVMKQGDSLPSFELLKRGPGICTDIEWLPNARRTAMASEGGFLLPLKSGGVQEKLDPGNHYASLSSVPMNGEQQGDLLCLGGRGGILVKKVLRKGSEKVFAFRDAPEELEFVEMIGLPQRKGYAVLGAMPTEGLLLLELDRNFELRQKIRIESEGAMPEGECHIMKLPTGPPEGGSNEEVFIVGTMKGAYRMDPGEIPEPGSEKIDGKELLGPFEALGRNLSHRGKRVFSVIRDHRGGIWMTVKGDLHHFDREGEPDTLPFKPLNIGALRALHDDPEGSLWIGGDYGLAAYRPEDRVGPERSFPCLIQEVRVPEGKGDSLLYGGFSMNNTRSIDAPVLPYERNKMVLSFVAPYHHRPEKLRYRWKLEGYQDEWTEWKDEEKVTYTNLAEGHYRFKVMARNVYGMKSEVATYGFEVLPPWYRTTWAYSGYGVLGVLLVWGVAWLNTRRVEAKKKQLEKIVKERTQEIREQKEQVEAAHQEISDSIEYAQKIQDALLQNEEHVSPHLPEHFILFKPQSRVSGDFYWAREKEGHLYVAAVDCTGHGVPGAFMSMLGIAYLNEILSSEGAPEPGTVLTELKHRVVRELTGEDPEKSSRDGMDAALLRIELDAEKERKEVLFAGANNPLYVVRNGIAKSEPHELLSEGTSEHEERIRSFRNDENGIEIKGEARAVGYDEKNDEAFESIPLSLKKGDMLYIFSDGYADQFGGPKGKKFRYKPFKDLLVKVHQDTPEEQKLRLDRTFEEWKNGSDQEQVDDVCVIGLRL